MSPVVVARRRSRSRSPLRGHAIVAYWAIITEMERTYLDGPFRFRNWPDLYGPSERSLQEWFDYVLEDRECWFYGQWSYHIWIARIRAQGW